jgi:hypothetical protein
VPLKRGALLSGLLLLGLWACTGGLLVDKGNAFPCNFDLPEAERDRDCPVDHVCSVANICRRFHNEGPQFEGPAPLPQLDGGSLVSPVLLRRAVGLLAADPRDDRLLAVRSGDELFELGPGGAVIPRAVALGGVDEGRAAAVIDGGVVVVTTSGRLLRIEASGAKVEAASATDLRGLRTAAARGIGRYYLSALRADAGAGANGPGEPVAVAGPIPFRLRPLVLPGGRPDAGAADPLSGLVGEVRYLPRIHFAAPSAVDPLVAVAVSPRGFWFRDALSAVENDDTWTRLNPDDELSLSPPYLFRHDPGGTLWAVAAPSGLQLDGGLSDLDDPRLLSTWRLQRSATAPRVVRAWSDCRPCGGGRILTFTPAASGGEGVEVLCESTDRRSRSLVKVSGAATPLAGGPCLSESLDPPIDLASISAVDETQGASLLLGGEQGELWRGVRLSELLPLHLDRVPQAIGTLELAAEAGADAGRRLGVAITDRFLAVPLSANGFLTFRLEDVVEATLPAGARPSAPVGDGSGWLILSSGDLSLLRQAPSDGGVGLSLRFGPRLVDGRGEAARGPYFGEAYNDKQGKLVSMVLTADDSLYFHVRPAEPEEAANAVPPLTPQLTPEPNFPIRSMTLERSGLGTDGVSFVRGYLVTSRNLYEYSLGGTPARWTAKQLVVASGEPLEVWMDHPRGGLGRIGFRDGRVFTLPSGFPLVSALPASDGGTGSDRVLDFENLGGWPVALAESGVYVGLWDQDSEGNLIKTHDGGAVRSMGWRMITLADGSQPWRGRGGHLQVLRRAPVLVGGQRAVPFSLLVFSEHGRVYEVGSLVRYEAPR